MSDAEVAIYTGGPGISYERVKENGNTRWHFRSDNNLATETMETVHQDGEVVTDKPVFSELERVRISYRDFTNANFGVEFLALEKHSDALFSHGICPDCAKDLYGNEPWFKAKKK